MTALRLMPPPPEEDDATLLARVAQGDAEAAHHLVLRHQGEVRRFVARMLGASDPAVDDVTQLALVAALDAAGRFDGRARARTWLIGIAHNKAKMHIRSQTRRRRAMDLLARLHLVAPPAPPRAPCTTMARIEAAVQTLQPDRRAAFVLCDVEGRTSAEAADCLGVPAGTLRRWRTEARRDLQPLLADLRPEGGPG